VKVRGLDKVSAVFVLAMAAYNIVRLPKLLAPRGEVHPAVGIQPFTARVSLEIWP